MLIIDLIFGFARDGELSALAGEVFNSAVGDVHEVNFTFFSAFTNFHCTDDSIVIAAVVGCDFAETRNDFGNSQFRIEKFSHIINSVDVIPISIELVEYVA